MLTQELNGSSVNKTYHRRYLRKLLNNRSEGSIEFKHQNISAVLVILGQPFISGYKPRYNYQKILEEKVIEYLNVNKSWELNFREFSEREIERKHHSSWLSRYLLE